MSVPLNDWHIPCLVQRWQRCHGNGPAPHLDGDMHKMHQDHGEVSQLSAACPGQVCWLIYVLHLLKNTIWGTRNRSWIQSNFVNTLPRNISRCHPDGWYFSLSFPISGPISKSTEAKEFITWKKKKIFKSKAKAFLPLYPDLPNQFQQDQSACLDFRMARRRFCWASKPFVTQHEPLAPQGTWPRPRAMSCQQQPTSSWGLWASKKMPLIFPSSVVHNGAKSLLMGFREV